MARDWREEERSVYGEIQRRSYYLRREGEDLDLVVSFFFRGESCKFVPTGETKTEELYELKCE